MNRNHRKTSFVALVIMLIAVGIKPVTAEEPLKQQLLVDEARIVIESFGVDPNMEPFRKYLKKAKAVLIVPDLYKGAWFIGGSGGRGVLMVRDKETDKWIGPAFYTMASVSFGFQFGGEKSEVAVLVGTNKGLTSLYSASIKLGADVSVAAGPIGGGAQGATAPSWNVDYISFARSKGAFLGLSLDGAAIHEAKGWNKAYYGKPVNAVDILVKKNAANPNSEKLRASLAKVLQSVK